MFTNKDYVVNAAGNTRRGVEYFPDDVKPGEKLLLYIFLHGKGEAFYNDGKWNGAAGGEDRLYDNGSPLQWVKDGKLGTVTSPVTGKGQRCAVLALQGVLANNSDPNSGWCIFADLAMYAIKNFLKAHPEIELVEIMGLSAGGAETWNCLNMGAGIFGAGVPMSAAGMSAGIADWNNKGIVWAMHSDNDGVTNYNDSVSYVKSINGLKPGMALLETTKTSHGGWDKIMDPSHRITQGKYTFNIYELLLIRRDDPTFLFTATGTTGTPAAPNQPTMSTSKAVAKATANGRNITLNSAGSVNAGGYDWQAVDPSGKNRGWLGLWGGKDLADKQWTVDQDGDWQFILTVTDAAGNKLTDTAKVTVGSAPVVTTPSPVVTAPPITDDPIVQTFTVNIRKSGKKEVI